MGSIGAHAVADTPEGRRYVVFFVDDEDALRLVTKRLLAKRGFDVIEAASAAEASEVIESYEGPIDVLLMDVNLPDGWGSLIAQRLRDVRPEMVVVYTTGFADSDPILSAALADAEWVVRKPFTGDQLADVLRRAIEES